MIVKTIKLLAQTVRLVVALAIAVYIASLAYVVSFSSSPNLPAHADAILVPGAKVNLDDTPSSSLLYRTQEAVKLFKEGKADYIMFTGGLGLGPEPEAEIGSRTAIEQGVPKDKILTEDISHNTYDNLAEIQKTAQAHGVKSVIVVSDRFHVARTVLVTKHFGFKPVYWDYPPLGYMDKGLIVWNYAREAAAMIIYVPRVFLGIQIPV